MQACQYRRRSERPPSNGPDWPFRPRPRLNPIDCGRSPAAGLTGAAGTVRGGARPKRLSILVRISAGGGGRRMPRRAMKASIRTNARTDLIDTQASGWPVGWCYRPRVTPARLAQAPVRKRGSCGKETGRKYRCVRRSPACYARPQLSTVNWIRSAANRVRATWIGSPSPSTLSTAVTSTGAVGAICSRRASSGSAMRAEMSVRARE